MTSEANEHQKLHSTYKKTLTCKSKKYVRTICFENCAAKSTILRVVSGRTRGAAFYGRLSAFRPLEGQVEATHEALQKTLVHHPRPFQTVPGGSNAVPPPIYAQLVKRAERTEDIPRNIFSTKITESVLARTLLSNFAATGGLALA